MRAEVLGGLTLVPTLTALLILSINVAAQRIEYVSAAPRLPAGQHLERESPVPLHAPWRNGEVWKAGGSGSFYGEGGHTDEYNDHYAVDWNWGGGNEDLGKPLLSPASGTVVLSGDLGLWEGGKVVKIQLEGDPSVTVHFFHLDSLSVARGWRVSAGQQLGTVGRSGLPDGYTSHIHMGVRQKIDGTEYSIMPGPLDGQPVCDNCLVTSHNTVPASESLCAQTGVVTTYQPTYDELSTAIEQVAVGRLGREYELVGWITAGLPPYRRVLATIPSEILKAMAWEESDWNQADYAVQRGSAGPPLIAAKDCGHGVMQITSGMRAADRESDPVPLERQRKIVGDYRYNVSYGFKTLVGKWKAEFLPVIGNNEPSVLEDWYYALWAYNSWGPLNNPSRTERYRGQDGFPANREPYRCDHDDNTQKRAHYPYQERVFGCIRNPAIVGGRRLWAPIEVSLPPREWIKYPKPGDIPDPVPAHTGSVSSPLSDTAAPSISSFYMRQASGSLGNPATAEFSVSDVGGSGMSRVEVWRADDVNGAPGEWMEVNRISLSGDGPAVGSLSDAPTRVGAVWYGLHASDTAGNWAVERNPPGPAKVTVNQSTSCPISITPANRTHGWWMEQDTVIVTAPSGCSWTASSNVSWINVISGTTGNGAGAVGYYLWANTTAHQRAGTVTVAGQTFVVTQAGAGWALVSPANFDVNFGALVIDPNEPRNIYVGTSQFGNCEAGSGMIVSRDGGRSWLQIPRGAGLADCDVTAIVLDVHTRGRLYAGTSFGNVFKSTDHGETWTGGTVGEFYNAITALTLDPLDANIIYAATDGMGLYRSNDAGSSWVAHSDSTWLCCGSEWVTARTLSFDPLDANVMYAATAGDRPFDGLIRSTNRGVSWSRVARPWADARWTVAFDPFDPSILYAGGMNVFRSPDRGVTWHTGVNYLPGRDLITAIAPSPKDPGVVFAATWGDWSGYGGSLGVVRWHDDFAGEWSQLGGALPPVTALAVDPLNGNHLFVGTARGLLGMGANAVHEMERGRAISEEPRGIYEILLIGESRDERTYSVSLPEVRRSER